MAQKSSCMHQQTTPQKCSKVSRMAKRHKKCRKVRSRGKAVALEMKQSQRTARKSWQERRKRQKQKT
eukprot:4664708-Pleurochrysis_carterae.AAC.2